MKIIANVVCFQRPIHQVIIIHQLLKTQNNKQKVQLIQTYLKTKLH